MNCFQRLAVLILWAFIAHGVFAQSSPDAASAQKKDASVSQSQSYSDTTDGLRTLLEQFSTAIEKNDTVQSSAISHNMILPDYQTWFAHVFGAEAGARMTQSYEKALPDFDTNLKELMARYIKDGMTEITATRMEPPEQSSKSYYVARKMKAMQSPIPIYLVEMDGATAFGWEVPGVFSFVQGNFRYLGGSTLSSVNGQPARIRFAGNVMVSRLLSRAQPVYPPDAVAQHIEGTEVLHAMIDYDGTVSALQWVSGPRELLASAMDAVKQWRYQPTLLNGEPVQVDTTITVVYTLEQK